ncbi:hypothetical protein HDU76_007008 [Blyttiomyces sp. JEL0837]|nr:hypothetical protein HDU76_007008 [Blyttiomyces sp. JEL0837]
MHLITILSLLTGLAATIVTAKPLMIDTVQVEKPIPGMHYTNHVKFVDLAPNALLQRRGGPNMTFTTSAPTPTPTPVKGRLVYYGGPVIPNVQVTPLWWGSGIQYSDKLPAFYGAVVNSTHFDMLKQYSISGSSIGRGTTASPITLNGYPTAKALDNDKDIVPYLRALVAKSVLNPTINSYYPIHFAPGISITMQGQGVIPDQSGACITSCSPNSDPFQSLCYVSSSQLVRATTDPAIGVAPLDQVVAPMAWYDNGKDGGEISELCYNQQGIVNGYSVQLEWSNKDGKCVVA